MGSRPDRIEEIAEPPSGETLLGLLSWDNIRDITSRNASSNGERYWRQGRVESLAVEKNGALIRAQVRGVPSRFVLELGDAISGISRVPSQAARSMG